MTVADVRTLLKTVVEAHATHNTFYSIWSVAKDRESELTYPCVIWDQWRARLGEDPMGYLHRSVLVRLLLITTVATDRTPLQRDKAVEAADNAAADIILKIKEDYKDLTIRDVSTTTQFDESTQLETGVLLTFTLEGEALCLDEDNFDEPDCPTFAELIAAMEWAEIKDEMSAEQIAEAEADLGGGDCDPLGYDLHNSLDEVILSGVVNDPCGGTLELTAPDAVVELVDAKGADLGSTDVPSGKTVQITAPSATVQLQDSEGENLGAPITVHAGASENIEAPDTTIQLRDSAGTNIGSADVYPAGTTTTKTAPDGTVMTTDGATPVMTVKSNGSKNLPQSVIKYKDASDASQVTAPSNTEFADSTLRATDEIPRREVLLTGGSGTGKYASLGDLVANTLPTIPQKLNVTWAANDGDTLGVVLPASMQGVAFSFVSETGTNGTITVSVNNGSSFAAPPFTPGASKVIFRRTITTTEQSALYTTA